VALVRFDAVVVPRWVARELRFARRQGWSGTVLSGRRTRGEQLAAAARYAASLGLELADVYPHGALASNHVGREWPAGAVDVTLPDDLARALRRPHVAWRGRRLVWAMDAGMNDRAHFSRTGH
jgi:hypothetical protein